MTALIAPTATLKMSENVSYLLEHELNVFIEFVLVATKSVLLY